MDQTPAPSDRRIPGWIVVLVLVVIGVLVFVPSLFYHFTSRFGPPLLLLHVTDEILATPGNATVPADLGPHCSPILWDPSSRSLTATSEVRFENAAGLLLQQFDRTSANIRSDGGDHVRYTLAVNGSAWTLASPVDSRALATFTVSGEDVIHDGSNHGPGASWPIAFAYNVTTPGGIVRIEESLTLINEGRLRPRIVVPDACM